MKNFILGLTLAVFITLGAVVLGYHTPVAYGSVAVSNEYQATTTNAAQVPVVRVLKPAAGSLAQVTITGKNTGLETFYDATTSDVNLRTGNTASSSILLADFPTNAPEGTYTFDLQTKVGILLVVSGAPATSTITYR